MSDEDTWLNFETVIAITIAFLAVAFAAVMLSAFA